MWFARSILSVTMLFLGIIMLFSCAPKKVYHNNKEHVKLGQEFAGKFYKQVSKNNMDSAVVFFSADVPKTEIIALLKQNYQLFGKLKEIKFITATSDVQEKNHQLTGEMELSFEANYGRLSTTETLNISITNDILEIEGYNYKVNVEKL